MVGVVQALVEVVGPAAGPGAQLGGLVLGEAVRGELVVVRPVRTGEAVAQVLEPEPVTAVALAEAFQFGGGAVAGGGVDVGGAGRSASRGGGSRRREQLGEGFFPDLAQVPADQGAQDGPLREEEVAVQEGDEVLVLPLGEGVGALLSLP